MLLPRRKAARKRLDYSTLKRGAACPRWADSAVLNTLASSQLHLRKQMSANVARGSRPCHFRTRALQQIAPCRGRDASYFAPPAQIPSPSFHSLSLVLDHQNSLAHAGLACSSTVTGRVNAKVEPSPGLDSTQMRPPCISMIRFEMARPSPARTRLIERSLDQISGGAIGYLICKGQSVPELSYGRFCRKLEGSTQSRDPPDNVPAIA
jgi:hypothetical protein